MSLFKVYEELSDMEKLILCTRDKTTPDIFKTYCELFGGGEGADIAYITQTANFDNCFNAVRLNVECRISKSYHYHVTPTSLRDASEEIIQRCIDWFDSLNIKGD